MVPINFCFLFSNQNCAAATTQTPREHSSGKRASYFFFIKNIKSRRVRSCFYQTSGEWMKCMVVLLLAIRPCFLGPHYNRYSGKRPEMPKTSTTVSICARVRMRARVWYGMACVWLHSGMAFWIAVIHVARCPPIASDDVVKIRTHVSIKWERTLIRCPSPSLGGKGGGGHPISAIALTKKLAG